MRDHDKERAEKRVLREFFASVHAEDRTPAFERLARSRPVGRAVRWRPAFAIAAVLFVAGAVAWLMPGFVGTGSETLSEEEQLALAQELSGWQGPLDFLLDTPSREVLFAPPSFELTTLTIPPPADAEEIQP